MEVRGFKIFQKGFNYSQDGPGNRLVYHLQGCNMRCKWCSNPESMGGSSQNCKDYTIEDILDEVKRSEMLFIDGGGVTLTGGEPTLQFDEVLELFKELKQNAINTAIETNGTHMGLEELLPYIDYLIMDFKHYDDDVHKRFTGISNVNIKKNISEILEMGRNILIRIPLINGFNTDVQGFLEFFRQHNTENATFEFLPYHEYGKDKWTKPYNIKNGFIDEQTLKQFEQQFAKNNLKVIKT